LVVVFGLGVGCSPRICGEDEFVEGNACVSCAAGTTNEAGDDPSGDDTLCLDACARALGGVSCEAYVKASNGEDDRFGESVALDGDTLAVGAPLESSKAVGVGGDQNNTDAPGSGAVYVFTRAGSIWNQQAYIKAAKAEPSDFFGKSVALDGDTLAVGAEGEASNATGVGGDQNNNDSPNSGAVYVFLRSGSTWTQQAYIKPSNTGSGDSFGRSVALDGDTLAVGAVGEATNVTGVDGSRYDYDARNSGAVYVFLRSGSTWAQQAYIKPSNTGSGDFFGWSVALDDDTLAVGAHWESSNATGVEGEQNNDDAKESGAVYVFLRSGSTWTQQAYIKASNTEGGDLFGFSVALDGDTLAVGAAYEDSNATGVGGEETNNSVRDSGAVYVFLRSGSTWTQQAYIKPSNTGSGDSFGWSVALDGDTLAVGAEGEASNATGVDGDQNNNDAKDSGAVYVFLRSGSTWSQRAYIKASNTGSGDFFGRSVALDGDTLAVGTDGEASNATGVDGDQNNDDAINRGAVYAYRIAP
jgi:hypothetical protein